jgi:hypothetical protein
MKEILYEHDSGVEMLSEEIKHELKKEQLRVAMGWTKQELNEQIDSMKNFFELRKKDIIKEMKNG